MRHFKPGWALFPIILLFGLAEDVVAEPPVSGPLCDGGSGQAILSLAAGGSSACFFSPSVPGSSLLEISVQAQVVPVTKIRFSLPDPPVGTLIGEQFHFPFTGDRVTGVEVDLGGCSNAGVLTLATLTILLPDTVAECAGWQVDSGCEVVDCDGSTRSAYATHHAIGLEASSCSLCEAYWQECFALPPYDLFPVCEAADVPLGVQLSWTASPLAPKQLRIGTDPTLVTSQTIQLEENTYSPGFLQIGTTYYWNVGIDLTGDVCAGGVSPIYSFTTVGTLAAVERTWSGVKILYH